MVGHNDKNKRRKKQKLSIQEMTVKPHESKRRKVRSSSQLQASKSKSDGLMAHNDLFHDGKSMKPNNVDLLNEELGLEHGAKLEANKSATVKKNGVLRSNAKTLKVGDVIEESNNNNNNNNNKTNETNKISKTNENVENYTISREQFLKNSYRNVIGIDELVSIASKRAEEWYESQKVQVEDNKKSRPFSSMEDDIIDSYLNGVCYFNNNWTRQQLCERIWSEERKVDSFWKNIYKIFPYRSKSSVYKHVRRRYHIFDLRAKWSEQDDEKLKELALVHPGKWKQIGELLGRMPEDCRDRWRNYIKCGTTRAKKRWSPDEEQKLITIVNEMIYTLKDLDYNDENNGNTMDENKDKNKNINDDTNSISDSNPIWIPNAKDVNWTIVSEKMNGVRSRIQCRYKWLKLNEKSSVISKPGMGQDDVVWLLKQIKKLKVLSMNDIKWKKIVKKYTKERPAGIRWTKEDFENALILQRASDDKASEHDFQKMINNRLSELEKVHSVT